MTAACHDIPGSKARALDPSPAAVAVLSHTENSPSLTSSHLILLMHKTKVHPENENSHRAILSWYQHLSHQPQIKASNPSSCLHLSPVRILPGTRSAKPGPGDTTTFGTEQQPSTESTFPTLADRARWPSRACCSPKVTF